MAKKKQNKAVRKKSSRKSASPKKRAGRSSGAGKKTSRQTSANDSTTGLQPTEVKVTAAKGRPMLTWVGKRPLSLVTSFPAQLVERHDALRILGIPVADERTYKDRIQVLRDLRSQWNAECWKDAPNSLVPAPEHGGLLFHGDNKEVLAHLLASGYRGKVNLVYIDPPFDSGADYVRKVSLRGAKGTAKIGGEGYTLGEEIQYSDIWANDNYLQFMYERLLLIRELLAETASIALHCDARRSHYLRLLLDEVFGVENFRAETVVKAGVKNVQAQFEEMSSLTLGSNSIFVYSKSTEVKYRRLQKVSDEYERGKWDTFWRGTDRPTMRYELFGERPQHGQWRWKEARARQAAANYESFLAADVAARVLDEAALCERLDEYYLSHFDRGEDLDFVRKSRDGVVQYYVPPRKYKLLSNLWLDLPYRGTETDYPTEKNEAIARRLVEWVSDPGDLVVDCFLGSGTVAAVAQRLGRRWIGCDINKGAIQTTAKRLRAIIAGQIEEARKRAGDERQGKLPGTGDDDKVKAPKPAQFGFAVWRVNDYDLNIQHNEAVNLACEHVGVQRMRSDAYFDGTLGKRLVKIIPFGHPLTPLDLEELKRELEARPDEDRALTLVCLGVELAAAAWVEDWNRMRKGKDAVNRIEVIELRTDAKYGRFIKHEPAKARVKITRTNAKVLVEVTDFISPTIIERLQQQAGVLQPKIEDWRAMVDCIMIDPAYDGSVLNVAMDDIPGRRDDLVNGRYEIPAPADETTVAVKIIDMLGEEVIVTATV